MKKTINGMKRIIFGIAVLLSLFGATIGQEIVAPLPECSLDDYGVIDWQSEAARLDNLIIHLKGSPESSAFIWLQLTEKEDAGKRISKIRKHFLFRDKKFDFNRLVFGIVRSENIATILYSVPPEAKLPKICGNNCIVIKGKEMPN